MWFHFRSRFEQMIGQFWGPLWTRYRSQNWSKTSICSGQCLDPWFCWVLKLFKCLLRAVLSVLCSSWEPPRLKKYGLLKKRTISLFVNAAFGYFEALEVLLGSILAHHGPLIFWVLKLLKCLLRAVLTYARPPRLKKCGFLIGKWHFS